MLTNATSGTVKASSVGKPQYVDYYYENANSIDTQACYGFIQATYTADAGPQNPKKSLSVCQGYR